MEKGEALDIIISIIIENRGDVRNKINSTTRLQKDLGVDGIDGETIMNKYFEQFSIDINSFIFTDYFGEEHFGLSQIINRFKTKTKQITIGHLLDCAIEGKWIIPN